jgi:prevent-host-death family protein
VVTLTVSHRARELKMSRSVGVRELKANPSKYLRMVREDNQEIEITVRGEVVARLVPVERRVDADELSDFWRRHQQLAEEISQYWPEGVSAVEAVNEQRREL